MRNFFYKLKILLFLNFFYFNLLISWSNFYNLDLENNIVNIDLFRTNDLVINKNFIEWTKSNLNTFNQLIFSWNAYRKSGYYSFWIKTRNKQNKKWSDWHEIAHWGKESNGKNIQKTFSSVIKNHTEYHYVRLESPNNFLDSFKIRIKAHNGADLSDIKKLFVNIVNNNKFRTEINSNYFCNLESVFINTVPKQSQMILKHKSADSLCSPTALSMLLGFLNNKFYDPLSIADNVYDYGLGIYGSWLFNVAHAFEICNGQFYFHVEKLNSFKDLHNYLLSNIPVVVSIRGPLNGGASGYLNGHLLVVVGYDKINKKIICHDSAFYGDHKTQVYYDLNDFLKAWEKSRRLSYIANANIYKKINKIK